MNGDKLHHQEQGPAKKFFLGCVLPNRTQRGITQPMKTFLPGPVFVIV